ncbi:MAG: hypothetical protein IJ407_01785 [Clostridia bacterium]|nr:hypothetical protein [Clostridia bacterium]
MIEINTIKTKPQKPIVFTEFTLIGQGGRFPVLGDGNAILLFLYSEGGGAVQIKNGDSVFAGKPLQFDIEPEEYIFVQLETGSHMYTSGTNKGHIVITSDMDDLEGCVMQLS